MKEKVLIVGSVAYDSVETAAGKVERALGGAATFAGVAASFYCTPCLVAVVGEDFDQEHLDYLKGLGVDLSGLQQKPGKTFHWAGRYHADMIGRETLDTQLNVFETFDPVLPEEHRGLPWVFLANIHPSLQARVLDQVSGPRFVLCDTMNLWIDIARDDLVKLFPRVDVLVINDEEVRQLTGMYNIFVAARALLDQGVRLAVIVKRGEHGSTLITRDQVALAPAYPVMDLVDPTGAGDSFAGALIGYLASTGTVDFATLRRALVHGAAMASFTVEGFSVDKLRGLTRANLETRIEAIKDLMSF